MSTVPSARRVDPHARVAGPGPEEILGLLRAHPLQVVDLLVARGAVPRPLVALHRAPVRGAGGRDGHAFEEREPRGRDALDLLAEGGDLALDALRLAADVLEIARPDAEGLELVEEGDEAGHERVLIAAVGSGHAPLRRTGAGKDLRERSAGSGGQAVAGAPTPASRSALRTQAIASASRAASVYGCGMGPSQRLARSTPGIRQAGPPRALAREELRKPGRLRWGQHLAEPAPQGRGLPEALAVVEAGPAQHVIHLDTDRALPARQQERGALDLGGVAREQGDDQIDRVRRDDVEPAEIRAGDDPAGRREDDGLRLLHGALHLCARQGRGKPGLHDAPHALLHAEHGSPPRFGNGRHAMCAAPGARALCKRGATLPPAPVRGDSTDGAACLAGSRAPDRGSPSGRRRAPEGGISPRARCRAPSFDRAASRGASRGARPRRPARRRARPRASTRAPGCRARCGAGRPRESSSASWLGRSPSRRGSARSSRRGGVRDRMTAPLEDVVELAHVAGPVVGAEARFVVRREREARRGARRRVAPEEVARQQEDVVAALAERRDGDGEDAEAEVEVAAERPASTSRGEVAVGGGDDAHVELAASGPRRRARSRPPAARGGAWPGARAGISPTSSRKSVPPSASSKRPARSLASRP